MILALVGSADDVDRYREIVRGLRQDPDTGLLHRISLYVQLASALRRCKERAEPLCLLAIRLGQIAGNDEAVLARIKEEIGSEHMVFRYDALRLVAILPGFRIEGANQVARRIRGALNGGSSGSDRVALAVTTTISCSVQGGADAAMRTLQQRLPSGQYQSVFISYGQPDCEAARRFYVDLESSGVETFYFPNTAEWGQQLHEVMAEGVLTHDRVLLLCSEHSLSRPGVLYEVQRVLAREASEGGSNRLLPVLLDDYLLKEWTSDKRILQNLPQNANVV